MEQGREFRELLAADAALMLGVAEAPDVAAALQRYWDRRAEPGVSFEDELAHIAHLAPEALERVRAEVERLLGEAGGDPKIALTRHGGLDRSIRFALGNRGANLTRALSVMGVQIRAPLRSLPPDRYVDFTLAGRGGMGVVYAAIDTELNRQVAFKLVRTDAGAPEKATPSTPLEATKPERETPASDAFEHFKARLVQEAWVTGGLEHPGIVPVYEIGQTPTGIPYYTMRYVRGERTMADVIKETKGAPFEERLALLESFLKVCDTVRYAHDRGVVHRDLKPANVALGQYGEVVLLDWGLARLGGTEDMSSSAWRERVEEMRHDVGFHTMEGGAVGTVGYMAPEAVIGRPAEVDQRSDVYSLGTMLFELLTGRLPFQFNSYGEYAALLLRKHPPEAREVEPSVPEALSSLCAKALAREKEARPTSAEEVARAIRAWQVEDAAEREREGLLRDARTALESAEGMTGDARLQQVDRAAAALAQVEAKRPGGRRAKQLAERAQALRETAIRERERASTRRTLRRAGVVALVAVAVAAFVVTTLIDAKRKEAEKARAEAERARAEAVDAKHATEAALSEKAHALVEVGKERDAKGKALDDVLRLADSKKIADLVAEADRLWPLVPEKAAEMDAWIMRAKDVLARRGDHRRRLATIRGGALPYTAEAKARDHQADRKAIEAGKKRIQEVEAAREKVEGEDAEAKRKALNEQAEAVKKEVAKLEAGLEERRSWTFRDPQVDWQHQVLVDLLAGLDRLDGGGKQGDGGYLADVEKRHEFVTTLRKRSVEDHEKEWEETIAAVAASPKYGGLSIPPQLGLVPLGPDPDSGLFEFAHLGSGSIPTRDERGHLVLTRRHGARPGADPGRDVHDGRAESRIRRPPTTIQMHRKTRVTGTGTPGGDPLVVLPIEVRVHEVPMEGP